ncbi:MAG: LptF/LptG family permease, partial [Chitinophagaceae bacterium]|nr:LptF/LptG family permease [Chitinophagaceae bacterium]
GLDVLTIVTFLGLLSTTLVPIALPLGILFAAIMTYGNLGENSELVAIKASGISVAKFTRPLFFFIILLASLSFLFNNYVIPRAQLKATRLLYDIQNKKPVIAIKEGTFYREIQNHTIYISKKDPDGKTVHDIKIYDHTSGRGNDKIVLAKKGKMYVTEDKRFLIFELEDGWRYEEKVPVAKDEHEQIRFGFKYWKKVFDLSDFKMPKTDENYFKNLRNVMTVEQIAQEIDTCRKNLNKLNATTKEVFYPALSLTRRDTMKKKVALQASRIFKDSILTYIPDTLKVRVIHTAEASVRSVKSMLEINKQNQKIQILNLTDHRIEMHKRFTLPVACILLFIIGAALGSIIRKGGIGMPFIAAVVFFIIYYFMNTIGENIAKEMVVSVPLGLWFPSVVLGIIGTFLMYKANTDSPLLNKEAYFRFFRKFKRKQDPLKIS